MSVAAIIPARYASSRFPGKPLATETGRPLIQHVCEAVQASRRVDRVLVATDDARIAEAVEGFHLLTHPTEQDSMKIVIEPSAAVCLAALLERRGEIPGQHIGIILSGGNADLDRLPWMTT